jgi:predicted PurR-regulated permease PerM
MEEPDLVAGPGAAGVVVAPQSGTVAAPARGVRRPLAFGFLLVAVAVTLLLLYIYRPLVRPLIWAAALATLVYPAHARLVRLLGGRTTVAAVITTAVSIAVLVLPSVLAVSQIVRESRDLWPRLQGEMGSEVFENAANFVEDSPLRRFIHLVSNVPEDGGAAALEDRLRTSVDGISDWILRSMRDMTLGAPTAMVHIGLTIVTFFFFLRQGPAWALRLREGLPLEAGQAEELMQTVARTINAVFRGVLLTAAAQGLLATLGYAVAGTPVPVLLGFLTLVSALLPFVGAVAVWLPTAIGMFISGHHVAAIGLTIWGAGVVSLVDNFLRPFFIGRGMRLPMLWLFLAIVGGLQSFGFLGLVLGPAALALFLACFRIYMQQRRAHLQP